MGLTEVQRALARISIDPALRARFFADPAVVGAEFGLIVRDALGLAQISRRQLEQFAESLHRKRRDQVRRVIPIAARALGRDYAALFERYLDQSAPRGSKADLDDAAGFVAAMGEWADDIEPGWAVELARYELTWRQAACAGRVPLVRIFRFPVAELATGCETEPVAPRATVACWWRPSQRATLRHLVLSLPSFGLRRR